MMDVGHAPRSPAARPRRAAREREQHVEEVCLRIRTAAARLTSVSAANADSALPSASAQSPRSRWKPSTPALSASTAPISRSYAGDFERAAAPAGRGARQLGSGTGAPSSGRRITVRYSVARSANVFRSGVVRSGRASAGGVAPPPGAALAAVDPHGRHPERLRRHVVVEERLGDVQDALARHVDALERELEVLRARLVAARLLGGDRPSRTRRRGGGWRPRTGRRRSW